MASYDYLTTTGTVIPDTGAVQSEVVGEYREAFGADLPVTPDTPQGVLIAGEVLARMSVLRNNAALANQINPNFAGGVALDATWALTGGQRRVASPSVATGVVLGGVPGTIIPATARIATAAGVEFQITAGAVIGVGGTVAATFQAVIPGPTPAAINTLTTIVPGTGVLGWETATNPTAAVLGERQQSDANSRLVRRQTLALQGTALAEAIFSAVRLIPGCRSLAFRENYKPTTEIIDGISLVPHSIWACVLGGDSAAIASVLLAKKSAGANWNGGQIVVLVEPTTGQTYPVQFERPTPRPIKVRVTLRLGSSLVDPIAAAKAAVLAYASGEVEGEDGFTVGGRISPFELASAVNTSAPGLFVQKVEVAFDVLPLVYATDTLSIALNEVATVLETAVEVVIL